jgi:hypothetical protein
MSCRDRVATYLQGIVGVRPMIDLNSHFLLVMNRDNSISVIDPAVGITGITNLFAQINLSRPGADWVLNDNSKKLFISMPSAGKVALADTESFKVTHEIEAGEQPMRVELQRSPRRAASRSSMRRTSSPSRSSRPAPVTTRLLLPMAIATCSSPTAMAAPFPSSTRNRCRR